MLYRRQHLQKCLLQKSTYMCLHDSLWGKYEQWSVFLSSISFHYWRHISCLGVTIDASLRFIYVLWSRPKWVWLTQHQHTSLLEPSTMQSVLFWSRIPNEIRLPMKTKSSVKNSDDGSYVSPVGLAKYQSVFVRLLGENRQENFSAKVKTSSRIHVDVINFPNLIRNRNCLPIEILVEPAEHS